MFPARALWVLLISTLHLLFLAIVCSPEMVDNVVWLSSVVSFVGQNVTLMWNTTNNKQIKSASFGISHEGFADPQFINVNTLTRKVHYNPRISNAYAGRVDFVGDLSSGLAWFRITNLQLNDTNEYLARITVDVDKVKSYTVRLIVRQPKEVQGQNDDYLATTVAVKTTKSNALMGTEGFLPTTSTSPDQTMMISITVVVIVSFACAVVFIIVFVISCRCYSKKIKKSKKRKQSYQITDEESSSKSLILNNNKEDKLLEKDEQILDPTAC